MTMRLDAATRLRLRAVARRRGRTPSEIARSALEAWLDGELGLAGASPQEAMADLIGSVRGGAPGRSTRGARGIAKAIRARRRRAKKRR
jgi:hypothetical protein